MLCTELGGLLIHMLSYPTLGVLTLSRKMGGEDHLEMVLSIPARCHGKGFYDGTSSRDVGSGRSTNREQRCTGTQHIWHVLGFWGPKGHLAFSLFYVGFLGGKSFVVSQLASHMVPYSLNSVLLLIRVHREWGAIRDVASFVMSASLTYSLSRHHDVTYWLISCHNKCLGAIYRKSNEIACFIMACLNILSFIL